MESITTIILQAWELWFKETAYLANAQNTNSARSCQLAAEDKATTLDMNQRRKQDAIKVITSNVIPGINKTVLYATLDNYGK